MVLDAGTIAITKDDFDPGAYIRAVTNRTTGAIVTFVGVVRDNSIESIEIEAYEEVALRDIREIRDEAIARHTLMSVTIIHRVGGLKVGDNILLIVVSAGHRRQAFEGCEEILERIKERAPIWKREILANGDRWVRGDLESG